MITTTLKTIKKHDPCRDGWKKLLIYLNKRVADDEPLPLATIYDSNGLHDTVWALKCVEGHLDALSKFFRWCADLTLELAGMSPDQYHELSAAIRQPGKISLHESPGDVDHIRKLAMMCVIDTIIRSPYTEMAFVLSIPMESIRCKVRIAGVSKEVGRQMEQEIHDRICAEFLKLCRLEGPYAPQTQPDS